MLTALCKGIRALARDTKKADGPFQCPACGEGVVLKKGRIVVHHFAHRPPVHCIAGSGESRHHHTAKLGIYDALRARDDVTELELEYELGPSIADIYAVIRGVPVAVEVQRTDLTVAQVTERTARYDAMGVAVLWVSLPKADLGTTQYSPSAWEKWCHAAYFGQVYYWQQGETLRAVHFDAHRIWVEGREWYDSSGELNSGGGYWKISKRWRTPNPGPAVQISEHFQPTRRQPWRGGTVAVPACTLYCNQTPAWWRVSPTATNPAVTSPPPRTQAALVGHGTPADRWLTTVATSAYRGDTDEPWRIKRMQGLAAQIEIHDNTGFRYHITGLHDHKGIVVVFFDKKPDITVDRALLQCWRTFAEELGAVAWRDSSGRIQTREFGTGAPEVFDDNAEEAHEYKTRCAGLLPKNADEIRQLSTNRH